MAGFRYARTIATVLALALIYLLFGFVAAPALIKRAIVDFASIELERTATVGEVRVNPLLLTLELENFSLAERDGTAILGFGRLLVDFEASSAIRRAWTFAAIVLDEPALRVEIRPDGKLNLAALLEKLPRAERRPEDRPPRLLLKRVTVRAGSIVLADRSNPTPASTGMRPVNLELRDLSTLPDQRGEYSFSARLLDGGTFSWRGEMSLEPLASRGEIRVAGVKPLTAWRFLRDELDVAEPQGEFEFGARYRARYAGGEPQLVLEDIRGGGRGISIAAAGAREPLLALASVAVSGGRFDLATRVLVLPDVEARDGAIAVAVDKEGGINWQALVRSRAAAGKEAPAKAAVAPERPWRMKVESLRVSGVGLRYADRSRARPVEAVAADLALGLAATVEARADGLQAVLDGISVTLAKAALGEAGAAEPLAAFDTVTVEGGRLDLAAREVVIGRAAINGGLVKVARSETGTVEALALFAGDDAGLLRREVEGALETAKAEGRPWRLALESLEVAGTRVAIADRSFGETVSYDAEIRRARVNGYRSDANRPVRFETSVGFAQGGALAMSGTLRPTGDEVVARVKLDAFNLRPLQPALFRRVQAVLDSGELSVDVQGRYRARDGRHEVRATGSARVDKLQLNETAGGQRLVGWKSLAADGIRLSVAPDELRVEEARVAGLDARIVVFKDRSVNLRNAIRLAPAATGGEAAPPAPSATLADLDPAFPISVGRVTFENGGVDFTDLSLVLPFAAKVHELEGVVQGLDNARAGRASVRLAGRVEEYGLARVEGSLRPFRPMSFLDLRVAFRNVDMPPLSAYSVTFAGRRITAGRLALDLRYRIDEGKLAGDNRVVLEKFTLGERVEAPGALDLPLDLAVALLTDSEGKIDVAVPVSGNLDDPKFNYGHVIRQAIGNLITRIVTAPFRALASLFGGGAEKGMETIAFDPGRAMLLPPEREKLARLAEGLGKRPQLRVVAEGQYGPSDRAALQQRDVEGAVATKLGRTTAEGGVPDAVNVTDAKTQRALEALFIERQSEQALAQFVDQTGKARGKPVQRVNAALALVGRGSADREFYEALLKRLSETATVPDTALAGLAAARARAVTEHLATSLSVPAGRVESRSAASPASPQVRLNLEAAPAPGPGKGG